jgi:uncharacterized protein (DUF1778 family)
MTTIQIELPDATALAARDAGLLTPQALERLINDALLDRELRVTLSKRDFAALTQALNGAFTPNRALKGALAKAAAKVRRA